MLRICGAFEEAYELAFKLELYHVEAVRRTGVGALEDNVPNRRLHDVHLDVMWREKYSSDARDQAARRAAGDDVVMQGPGYLVRGAAW